MTGISVALATYNGASFVGRQLASLASQHLLPSELVVCDDASTDDLIAQVRAFAATAPFPVRVAVNRQRVGYRANFMGAAGLCRAELIAFCDQDDLWHPRKLAEIAARFDDPAVLLVHHNAQLVDAQGGLLGRLNDGAGADDTDTGPMAASPWQFPQGLTMTFRRELLALSPLRERSLDYLTGTDPLAHDQWIYLLALVFGRIRFIPEMLVDYRQHATNTYGVTRTLRNRRERFMGQFEKFCCYPRYADACTTIAALLREGQTMLDDRGRRARARQAAASFDELALIYRRRGAAYASRAPLRRLGAWLALARDGRYGRRSAWSFGRTELVRDLVLGVCLARSRRRSGRDPFRDWSLRVNGAA